MQNKSHTQSDIAMQNIDILRNGPTTEWSFIPYNSNILLAIVRKTFGIENQSKQSRKISWKTMKNCMKLYTLTVYKSIEKSGIFLKDL